MIIQPLSHLVNQTILNSKNFVEPRKNVMQSIWSYQHIRPKENKGLITNLEFNVLTQYWVDTMLGFKIDKISFQNRKIWPYNSGIPFSKDKD